MTWSGTREGEVIHADLGSILDGPEWEALLLAIDAENVGTQTSQVVIHAGERLPPLLRETLVASLEEVIEALGINVRVVYAWPADMPPDDVA
jgi:hypothetical protein